MILAAGLGTRLGEIGRHTPKALVDVGGITALERVARRLTAAGADRLIINVHHHADRIMEYVRSRGGFGVDVMFSHEEDAPLETGGGIMHARGLFRGDAPFLVHNVDVLCDADLAALYAAHGHDDMADRPRIATLAVNRRITRRYLDFEDGSLSGRLDPAAHERDGSGEHFAFAGIHVIAPGFFDLVTERGAFSIMDAYLRLAAEGHRIAGHDISDATWLEIGTPERLAAARRLLG
ncbi:MAG TPA: sugar phosphate nucleotidyltransferase [Longimicrobiales bacterium]|nr:sugar phosphate nucleotidyltransferase [Longimicrobiales bacterium]